MNSVEELIGGHTQSMVVIKLDDLAWGECHLREYYLQNI